VVVRLGAQEEAGARLAGAPGEHEVRAERGLAGGGGEAEVLAAALRVEPGRDGERLDDHRLAAAVVTDEERDPAGHGEPAAGGQPRDRRQVERIPARGGGVDPEPLQVLRGGHALTRGRSGPPAGTPSGRSSRSSPAPGAARRTG